MIELSRCGGIAIVRMNHGKANALDIELCDALAAQFEACRDAQTKAIVLIGQGGMFSAGVDLLRLCDAGAPYVRSFLPALHRLYQTVFLFPKPVVAAVNGHAIAGGCVLQACRPAHRRLGRGPHWRHRAVGRRAVSSARFRDHAVCHAASILCRNGAERRDL